MGENSQPGCAEPELTAGVDEPLSPAEDEWCRRAIHALEQAGVPFLTAGAFARYYYSGMWRGTKDLDLLVLPRDRDKAIRALTGAGFHDLYEEEPYDREWIFRAKREDVIIDLIWRMANKTDDIGPDWVECAARAQFRGIPVRVVSAAHLCWMKLFVVQRERCDWPDILNIIRGTAGHLDWNLLLSEAGPHWRLLVALTEVYDWLCPGEENVIPEWFRKALEERRCRRDDAAEECRRDLLDSRPWLTELGAGHPSTPGTVVLEGEEREP